MKTRYQEFDSIRGIAALTVLIHHCLLVIPTFYKANMHQENSNVALKVFTNSPLHLIWAGHEAVILFFVLSGFVLTISINNNKYFEYKGYFIKRFCRIYIPYIFIMFTSILLFGLYRYLDLFNVSSIKDTSVWFSTMWSENVSFKAVVSVLFMLGFQTHNLNTVTWSLVHELRISLFFPVIVYYIFNKDKKYTEVKSIFCLLILWLGLMLLSRLDFGNNVSYVLFSFASTFYYSLFFILGSVLAKKINELKNYFSDLNIITRISLTIVSLIFYLNEWMLPFLGDLKYGAASVFTLISNYTVDIFSGLGVFLFFCIVISSKRIKLLLNNNFILFLGKISFSLYLVHPIVLLVIINLLSNYVDKIVLISLSFALSIIISKYLYMYLEIPTIKLGKRMANYKRLQKTA